MSPRERVHAGEVISKGEFAQLLPIGPSGGYIGFRSEAQMAYDRVIDRLHQAEDLLKKTQPLVEKVVTPPCENTPTIRAFIIGLMLPWAADYVGHVKRLCSHYEAHLKDWRRS